MNMQFDVKLRQRRSTAPPIGWTSPKTSKGSSTIAARIDWQAASSGQKIQIFLRMKKGGACPIRGFPIDFLFLENEYQNRKTRCDRQLSKLMKLFEEFIGAWSSSASYAGLCSMQIRLRTCRLLLELFKCTNHLLKWANHLHKPVTALHKSNGDGDKKKNCTFHRLRNWRVRSRSANDVPFFDSSVIWHPPGASKFGATARGWDTRRQKPLLSQKSTHKSFNFDRRLIGELRHSISN